MSEESELLLQRIHDLTLKLDAEAMARQAAETGREASDARAKELLDRESASTTQQPRTHGQQQDYRSQTSTSLIMSQNRVLRGEGKNIHL